MTLLTYFSHHGGRMRSLLDTFRRYVMGRGTQGSGQPSLFRRALRQQADALHQIDAGRHRRNALSTGRASSGDSSTIRTRSERRPCVNVTSPAARTLLTQSEPG